MSKANKIIDLLDLKEHIFIKINRESVIQNIFSDEGRISSFSKTDFKKFEELGGTKLVDYFPSELEPYINELVFKTFHSHIISSLTFNQILHTELPFSIKMQAMPLENLQVGIWLSVYKEDYISTDFYERLPVMLLYLNDEDEVIWANQQFYRKSKFEAAQLVTEHVREFLKINLKISQRDALRTKETSTRTEYNLLCGDGSKLIVIVSAINQYDEEGKFLCTSVVLRDVTQMKHTQIELEYQKLAIDESAIVAATDAKGNIIYANDKFCEISKFSREEVLGQNHRILKSDHHSDDFFLNMWKTISSGKVWRGEVCNINKEGNKYWVYTTIIPYMNDKNKPYRYQAIRFEITERKELEKQIVRYTQGLEKLVEERTQELNQKSELLKEAYEETIQQNEKLETKNRYIQKSINYAKRIQDSILPKEELLPNTLKDYFIFFRPKDVVSGDFYWWYHNKKENCWVISAVDCTGHGVPGAFMSMIGSTLLDETVKTKNITNPAHILKEMQEQIADILQQTITHNRDGMDMAIVTLNKEKQKIYVAGAKNPVFIVQNGNEYWVKGDRMSIGGKQLFSEEFTTHEFDWIRGTKIYLFSDGYQDQFGGEKGSKFMRKNLRELLSQNAHLSMREQKQILADTLEKWRSGYNQIDDILVMGFQL
ncbi:PAS domain-containing protein [Bernardetia sp. Wsw4-3y2]|uniref:PAS domain-containing protein n=1 Tax=Bernardetia sp. Wsw4-3y2 TaxID=3127471 RepID=UPI0030D2A1DD